ncbi:hypothetical protein IWW56_000650 [Coemansia sp. RSA 2131]|nr:hypothetical protein IWW56_000650 [Coemansia sp. RSA 2131]
MFNALLVMDDILQTIKQEITLDCDEGSRLGRVWEYVALAQQKLYTRNGVSVDTSVDDDMKAYLWPSIVRMQNMLFVNGDTTIYNSADPDIADTKEAQEFIGLSFAEVEAQYPDLVVRASQPAINKILFGREEGIERVLNSSVATKYLMCLSRARKSGVTQMKLTKKYNIDARSTFHYIKILDQFGLVLRFPTYENGSNTNLLVLRRFIDKKEDNEQAATVSRETTGNEADGSAEEYADTRLLVHARLRENMMSILQASETGYMVETDLFTELKLDVWNNRHHKHFHRIMRYLNEHGYVETVLIQLPNIKSRNQRPSAGDSATTEGISASVGDQTEDQADEARADDSAGTNDEDGTVEPSQSSAKKSRNRKRTRPIKEPKCRPGYSYRRCARFIKPYVDKRKVRSSVGIPLQAKDRTAIMHDVSGSDDDANMSSSDDEAVDIDAVKEKDDISNMLAKPQVFLGKLALLPIDVQIVRMIALSGTYGIVMKAIQFLMREPDYRAITRCLERLENIPLFLPDGSFPGIYTSPEERQRNLEIKEAPVVKGNSDQTSPRLLVKLDEFSGREHRKRFFINPLAQPLIDALTADTTSAEDTRVSLDSVRRNEQPEIEADVDAQESAHESADDAATGNEADAGDEADVEEGAVMSGNGAANSAASLNKLLASRCEPVEVLLEDAKSRQSNLISVIREQALLRLLEHESVLACGQRLATRCGDICKAYYEQQKNSKLLSLETIESVQKHGLDKRTFMRIVDRLANKGQLRVHVVDALSRRESNNPVVPVALKLLLEKSVDPQGVLVEAFITQLRDRKTFSAQSYPTKPRTVDELIHVQRSEGAEQSDQRHRWRDHMEYTEFRENYSPRFSGRRKRAQETYCAALTKRARVILERPETDLGVDPAWPGVLRRLKHPPRRIGRAVDLYTYLVETVHGNVDSTNVFANSAFRSGILFEVLPLRQFVDFCGGISSLPMLLPYIRDGQVTFDSDNEDTVGMSSTIDEINERLAAPVGDLPEELRKAMVAHKARIRSHIQQLLFALQVLQLIRPVRTAKDIVALPPPPTAEQAFKRVEVKNPKTLYYGYQLIAHVRQLSRHGYSQLVDAFENKEVVADLTTSYLTEEVYDMMDPKGRFQYFSDLEASARQEGTNMTYEHPLYGIGIASHWRRPVMLLTSQTRILDTFVDTDTQSTPLDDVERLCEAAAQAGATPEEARRYYQHVYARILHSANKRNSDRKRHAQMREKVNAAKDAAFRKQQELHANRPVEGPRVRRMPFSNAETQMVGICFAVLRHHARSHNHPFLLGQNVLKLFPTRTHHTKPTEALRHHWFRMVKLPNYRALDAGLNVVWKFVLRDAVQRGELVDDPDFDNFDVCAAARYFDSLLQRTSVKELENKYADDIALEVEHNQHRQHDIGARDLVNQPRGSQAAVQQTVAQPRPRKKRTWRLPSTMVGQGGRYIIDDIKSRAQETMCEFSEDVYRDGIVHRSRRNQMYATMLTTHSGFRSTADYSNPVSTMIRIESDPTSTDPANVDNAELRVDAVTQVSDHPFYAENMSRSSCVRTINSHALVERIHALLNTNVPATSDSDAAIACVGEPGVQVGRHVAESTCMQALIMNLVLTPQREYNVDTGHALLSLKQEVAAKAFATMSRTMTISRLRKMESTVGMDDPKDGDQSVKSTVVVHETTGSMRTDVRAGSFAGSTNESESNSVSKGTGDEPEANGKAKATDNRMVPGRGYAASDKFLNAIASTLPEGFLDTRLPDHYTSLDQHMDGAELLHVCSLIGEGKLWIRPQYASVAGKRVDAALGFRRHDDVDMINFGLNVVASTPPSMPMNVERSDAANVELSHDMRELAHRLVLGIIDVLGPLGASILELTTLVSKLPAYAPHLFATHPELQSALCSQHTVHALLLDLVATHRVYVVGSNDRRYVSSPIYYAHWTLQLDDSVFGPRLGQNLSGSTNTTLTLGILAAVLGRIFSNPGISQAVLMRRYFAPFVSKFEVLHYVDVLVEMGVVREEVNEDAEAQGFGDAPYPLQVTYYRLAHGYQHLLSGIGGAPDIDMPDF